VAQPPNEDFDPVEVSGEEQYVVTLAEMLLAIKKQLDRIEMILEIVTKPQIKIAGK
jgi:hypothetical protein